MKFWTRFTKLWTKFKKLESPSVAEITSRVRGFLLDSQVTHPHDMAELVGCSPISDEVAEMEEEQSDARLEEISALIPLIYAFSHTMAEATIEHQRITLSEEMKNVPPEVWTHSRKLVEQVGMATLLGAVSQLLDMGLIQLHPAVRRK